MPIQGILAETYINTEENGNLRRFQNETREVSK